MTIPFLGIVLAATAASILGAVVSSYSVNEGFTLEDFAREAARQVPALVVLVCLVWKGASLAKVFLSHLSERDDKLGQYLQDRDDRFSKSLEAIGAACHQHSEEVLERYDNTLTRTVKSLDAAAKALGEASALIRENQDAG